MSLMLELKPEEENALFGYARAEGVTPDRFVARLVAEYQPNPAVEPGWKTRLRAAQEYAQATFIASGKTEEELGEEIDAQIRDLRKEYWEGNLYP